MNNSGRITYKWSLVYGRVALLNPCSSEDVLAAHKPSLEGPWSHSFSDEVDAVMLGRAHYTTQ